MSEILANRHQLRALSNPTRLSLYSSLRADGPASARELASRLGVDEVGLYYHLRLLLKLGLLTSVPRPTATKPEAVFSALGPLKADLDLSDPLNLAAVIRNVDSLMRSATKEYREAVEGGHFDQSMVGRAAVRLTPTKREELRVRLRELMAWLGDGNSDTGERVSFTFVASLVTQ